MGLYHILNGTSLPNFVQKFGAFNQTWTIFTEKKFFEEQHFPEIWWPS